MEQLKTGFARIDDPLAREWLDKIPEFDSGVLSYPTTRMLCSYNSHPIGFLPIQKAVVLESMALSPNSDEIVGAQAMRDLFKGAELCASSDGIREIYFLATDETMVKVAEKHNLEKLKWPVYRMRLDR